MDDIDSDFEDPSYYNQGELNPYFYDLDENNNNNN